MKTFILQTLALIEVALTYPVSLAIHGKAKARAIRSAEIDRILGVK